MTAADELGTGLPAVVDGAADADDTADDGEATGPAEAGADEAPADGALSVGPKVQPGAVDVPLVQPASTTSRPIPSDSDGAPAATVASPVRVHRRAILAPLPESPARRDAPDPNPRVSPDRASRRRHRPPAQVRLAGGRRLVEAADRGVVRGAR